MSSKDRRACWASSFGAPKITFCSCTAKEAEECRSKYEQHRKRNYKDSIGQDSFKCQKKRSKDE